jgi:transposase-like protein
VGETYIKVKGQWMYLYRAVDSEGNTIDFYLNKTRDYKTEKRFFKKLLRPFHVSKPRVITVAKNPAYPIATEELKREKNARRHRNDTYAEKEASLSRGKVCPRSKRIHT